MEKALRILNVVDHEDWLEVRHLPRAVQPIDYSLSPCTRCPSVCCHNEVRLSVVEALRMAFSLGLPLAGLVAKSPWTDDVGHAHGWPIVLDDGRYLLRLHRHGTRCAQLYAPSPGHGRCGMWSLRPGVCRVYPFELVLDDERYKVGDQRFCAVQWLQDDKTRAKAQADLDRWRADVAADRPLVTRWNRGRRKDRSFAGFLEHLHRVVAPALGYDAADLDPLPARKLGWRAPS